MFVDDIKIDSISRTVDRGVRALAFEPPKKRRRLNVDVDARNVTKKKGLVRRLSGFFGFNF